MAHHVQPSSTSTSASAKPHQAEYPIHTQAPEQNLLIQISSEHSEPSPASLNFTAMFTSPYSEDWKLNCTNDAPDKQL